MTTEFRAGLAVDGVNVYWAAVTGTIGAEQIRSVPSPRERSAEDVLRLLLGQARILSRSSGRLVAMI